MHKLSDAQVKILFSLCSYNFIAVDKDYNAFASIMLNIETLGNNVVFNEDLIAEVDLEPFLEWLFILLPYFFSGR